MRDLIRDVGPTGLILCPGCDAPFNSKPENLDDIKKAIIDSSLDLGLAFDGDGDRDLLVASDADGTVSVLVNNAGLGNPGVMLNQSPIFLGGQGGLVGPCRLAFGTITAAGTINRKEKIITKMKANFLAIS